MFKKSAQAPVQAEFNHDLGRDAAHPGQIPWRGWQAIVGRALQRAVTDRAFLTTAGCAFYAMLAMFPAITMLVFIYGLVFDRATVEPQMQTLRELLPRDAFTLIDNRVRELVAGEHQARLTTGLVVSLGITLWSSAAATRAILGGLNLAYRERERRGFLHFQLLSFAVTLTGILAVALTIATLVFLPALMAFLGLSDYTSALTQIANMGMLLGFVLVSVSILYRIGPSRRPAGWLWILPGAFIATCLWLVASTALSFYIGHIASYDFTYGPLGAVVGVMMWFYVTVYVVLFGAELNAQAEMQTICDTCAGAKRPIGERGAYVADHVADLPEVWSG